jgi:predicted esterase
MARSLNGLVVLGALILASPLGVVGPVTVPPAKEQELLERARRYLACEDPAARAAMARELAGRGAEIDRTLAALRPVPRREFTRGYSGLVRFSAPGLAAKYANDQLYYYVPASYDPAKPTGLLILMHGGGGPTKREYAGRILQKDGYAYSRFLEKSPYLTVSPSAPWDEKNDSRWTAREAEAHLAAVIAESEHRFAIDPHRIVLAGYSMGGMGAYGLGVRMADRFAAVSPGAGMWSLAYWKASRGTPFFIIHGANDAVPPGDPRRAHRPKYTDVAYARLADALLTKYGLDHVYAENDKGHDTWEAVPEIKKFFAWMVHQRRDPFPRRVVAATPADGACPSPHNRWLSILEIGAGSLAFDAAEVIGETGWKETLAMWQSFRIEHRTKELRGERSRPRTRMGTASPCRSGTSSGSRSGCTPGWSISPAP